ncbi:MAG: InlB B-repeat-containing protein [Ruminococcus sp.]|nr:InlB B-repeat-containing protein [Ruminococcus sp.]
MNSIRSKKCNIIRRCFALIISLMVIFSCSPVEAMAATINGYLESRLEYQQIEAFESSDGTESVALNGKMPVGAEVSVLPIKNTDSSSVCSYDITITRNGKEFQPEKDEPITVGIKNILIGAVVEADYTLRLWHILDDGSREEITDFIINGDTISFEASGFSVYQIENENDIPLRTYEFYREGNPYEFTLDSGTLSSVQTIKSGEKLTVPQLPANDVSAETQGQTFIGWFESNDGIYPSSATAFDFSQAQNFDTCAVKKLVAVYSYCAYIIFHEQYDPTKGSWPVVSTRRGELADGKTTIPVGDISVSYDSSLDTEEGDKSTQKIFVGWSTTAVKKPGHKVDENGNEAVLISTYDYTISENVDLYPVFSEIHWVTFDTCGGNFLSPVYYFPHDKITQLTVPTKTGYAFKGWYTAETGGTQITDASGKVKQSGGMTIDSDVHYYAQWTPSDTTYTVVIWKQSRNDRYDATEKTYDYEASYKINSKTGSSVSVANTYKKYAEYKGKASYTNPDFLGFYYGGCDNAKTVAGDGSTVLNVYYDRAEVTYQWIKNNKTIYKITGLYGQSFGMYGYSWLTDEIYKYQTSEFSPITYLNGFTPLTVQDAKKTEIGSIAKNSLSGVNEAKEFNLDLIKYASVEKQVIHHLQLLDGSYSENDPKYTIVTPNSVNRLTITDKFAPEFLYYGYTHPKFSNTNIKTDVSVGELVDNYNNPLHVYHKRQSYTLDFYTKDYQDDLGSKLLLYELPLAGIVNDIAVPEPPPGYEFAGWFLDPTCTKEADIDSLTMPGNNLALFAGWKPITYEVTFDPNGGELSIENNGTKEYLPTTYYVNYGDTSINKYDEAYVHRDYIAADNGSYFYHTEPYDGSDPQKGGRAYYTDDITDATDLSKTYKEELGTYRFADWYEVDPETGEETIYNFNQAITHDTHLVLHWKELATYFIEYDPGKGNIDINDSNVEQFKTLDNADYADHAKVIVTRTINDIDGPNFVGWKIRNDKSGILYYPGQSFEFQSEFAEVRIEGDTEKKYIVLDAVYEEIGTAKLTYDANGGTMAVGKNLGTVYQNYNKLYADGDDPTYVTYQKDTGTISNIPNNSYMRLADGSGLSFVENGTEYVFGGWNTKSDGTGTHYEPGTLGIVDKEDPCTLYAEWKLNVYFDKKRTSAEWSDPEKWTEEGYDLQNGVQHKTVFYNSVLQKPSDAPYIKDNDKLLFRYWTEEPNDVEGPEPFDFSNQIKQDTWLYAYYSEVFADLYVVDASLVNPKYAGDEWYGENGKHIIFKGADAFDMNTRTDPDSMINPQNGYVYAFAYIGDYDKESDPEISEKNKITSLRYSPELGKIVVKYGEDTEEKVLPDKKSVFLVYYQHPKNLPINYEEASANGALTDKTSKTKTSAPKIASIGDSVYEMKKTVSTPLTYLTDYSYASYAIGKTGATNISDMLFVTDIANDIQVKDSWKGIEYSVDNGQTWYSSGDDVQLYVLYYPTKPCIINLREKTIGNENDLKDKFEYTISIQNVTREDTLVYYYKKKSSSTASASETKPGVPKNNGAPETTTVYLSNDMSDLYTLTYSSQTGTFGKMSSSTVKYKNTDYYYKEATVTVNYQVITIVQNEGQYKEKGYSTYHTENGVTGKEKLIYTFSSDTSQSEQNVLFVNQRKPEPVELHVAVSNGEFIELKDEFRSPNEKIYMLSLPDGTAVDLETLNDKSGSINTKSDTYDYLGIFYAEEIRGESDNQQISLKNMISVDSVNYRLNGNVYEYYINGNESLVIDDEHKLYYVYYPAVNVHYYYQKNDNTTEKIETVTRNGKEVVLNGTALATDQKLSLPNGEFNISGNVGSSYTYPPNLDFYQADGTCEALSLVLPKVGIKDENGVMVMSPTSEIKLKTVDGLISYSLDGKTWEPLSRSIEVDIIYKQYNFFDLTFTKTVVGDVTDNAFTLTLTSDKLSDGVKYTASDGRTFTAENNSISFTISHEDTITIFGLPKGGYTVTESDTPTGCIMSAVVNGYIAEVENNSFSVSLTEDSTAEIENKIPIIAATGYSDKSLPYMIMTALFMLAAGIMIIIRRKCREVKNVDELQI